MSDREVELEHRAGERIAGRFTLGTNLAANTWTALDEPVGKIVIVRFDATYALAQQRFAALLERHRVAPSAVPEPLLASDPEEPPFIAREYLLGSTLESQLADAAAQKRAGLGGLAFELFARGLTGALAALHRGRFVHGALSTARIVTLESRVRLLGLDSRQATLARVDRVEYASPRVVAGESPTPADDLWSLGLLTFRVLTGQSYWSRTSARELSEDITRKPLLSPSERARELNFFAPLPRGYDDWFRACVTRDDAHAYLDGTDALDALETLVLGGRGEDDTGRPSVCLNIAPYDSFSAEIEDHELAPPSPCLKVAPASPVSKLAHPVPCLSPARGAPMPCLSVPPPHLKEPSAIEPIEPGQGDGGPYRTRAWRVPERPRRSPVGCAVLVGVAVTGALLAYWLAR